MRWGGLDLAARIDWKSRLHTCSGHQPGRRIHPVRTARAPQGRPRVCVRYIREGEAEGIFLLLPLHRPGQVPGALSGDSSIFYVAHTPLAVFLLLVPFLGNVGLPPDWTLPEGKADVSSRSPHCFVFLVHCHVPRTQRRAGTCDRC